LDQASNAFTFGIVPGVFPGSSYSVSVSFRPKGYTEFSTATTCSSITLARGNRQTEEDVTIN
jgi:hypothetical protein